jgi:hypothetical protein
LSKHTDNPELEDDQMASRVIDTDAREGEEEDWIDAESGDEEPREQSGWDDGEEAELAPRPRGRLLRPLPLLLIAVTIAAAGFLGGVLAQKGSEGGSSAAALPGGGELPAFAAAQASGSEGGSTGGREAAAGGSESAAATGLPSFGGTANAAATGTVTSVEGRTIYVKESDGTVVAVKAADGSTVTRDSNVAAKKIHPGDSVVAEGSKHGSTVKASSIAATESGVEPTTGFGAPGGGSEEETSVESLFEE